MSYCCYGNLLRRENNHILFNTYRLLFGTRQSPSVQDSAGNHYRSQQKIIKGDGPTLCLHTSQTKRKKTKNCIIDLPIS